MFQKGKKLILHDDSDVAFDVGVHRSCLACFELILNAGYGCLALRRDGSHDFTP